MGYIWIWAQLRFAGFRRTKTVSIVAECKETYLVSISHLNFDLHILSLNICILNKNMNRKHASFLKKALSRLQFDLFYSAG